MIYVIIFVNILLVSCNMNVYYEKNIKKIKHCKKIKYNEFYAWIYGVFYIV